MIVAFCGHSKYISNKNDEKKIFDILNAYIRDEHVEFFLGEYGAFDDFAYRCAKKYKEIHPHARLVFITPYISLDYQKNHLSYQKERFDDVIYPGLENVPIRFAISHRNKWIIQKADLLIAYITHTFGGAYDMYRYAKGKCPTIINIAPQKIN